MAIHFCYLYTHDKFFLLIICQNVLINLSLFCNCSHNKSYPRLEFKALLSWLFVCSLIKSVWSQGRRFGFFGLCCCVISVVVMVLLLSVNQVFKYMQGLSWFEIGLSRLSNH